MAWVPIMPVAVGLRPHATHPEGDGGEERKAMERDEFEGSWVQWRNELRAGRSMHLE